MANLVVCCVHKMADLVVCCVKQLIQDNDLLTPSRHKKSRSRVHFSIPMQPRHNAKILLLREKCSLIAVLILCWPFNRVWAPWLRCHVLDICWRCFVLFLFVSSFIFLFHVTAYVSRSPRKSSIIWNYSFKPSYCVCLGIFWKSVIRIHYTADHEQVWYFDFSTYISPHLSVSIFNSTYIWVTSNQNHFRRI